MVLKQVPNGLHSKNLIDMILNTKEERADKLFDYVQTLLEIENPEDLTIFKTDLSPIGFNVDCSVYVDPNWKRQTIVLSVGQILLMEFTKSNNNDSTRIL